MKWLITGGCGFLGTSLIKYLKKDESNSIRIIDNLSVGKKADLSKVCEFREIELANLTDNFNDIEFIEGDIRDTKLALDIVRGCDVIVHFAANTGVRPSVEVPRQDMEINVVGTFNYLEAARLNKIPKFIFASSGAPAGEVDPPIHEELPPHPVSPYGASKLAGEGYCSSYYRTFGIETIALRFGNVYGPGSLNKNSVVAKFIKQAVEGDVLEIFGDGNQTRDFIYISDLIEAIILAAHSSGFGGETFQIATNKETSIDELAQILINKLSNFGYSNTKLINGEKKIGDVHRNFSDTSKARELLGWTSSTPLNDGLEKTIKYFLNN